MRYDKFTCPDCGKDYPEDEAHQWAYNEYVCTDCDYNRVESRAEWEAITAIEKREMYVTA